MPLLLKSGLVKGGVLHHFGTKDALVSGVVRHVMSSIEAGVEQELLDAPEGSDTYLQALIRHTGMLFVNDRGLPRALLLAVSENDDANKFLNEFLTNSLKRAKEKIDSGNAKFYFLLQLVCWRRAPLKLLI